jgi:hypothetical protein
MALPHSQDGAQAADGVGDGEKEELPEAAMMEGDYSESGGASGKQEHVDVQDGADIHLNRAQLIFLA